MNRDVFLLVLYLLLSRTEAASSTTKKYLSTSLISTTKSTIRTTETTTEKMTTTEQNLTPLPKSLSEKMDYQIYQTRLLTNTVEENHLALKRLLFMISHLLDNNTRIPANYTATVDKQQHIENIRKYNHTIQNDNDTLHVSFGTAADPSRYPWAVAISGNERDRCGGTLIDDQHVLTAAHCIGTRTTTVFLGSHLYDEGEEVKTDFYCLHNAYSSSNYYRNDIAIIRLAKPAIVESPQRVSTINICNKTNHLQTNVSSNTVNLWMVGWGLKNTNIEPDELQEAQVTVANRSMCKGSNRYTDMCVQSRSSTSPMGACTGDSGSGLFQQTILTDQWCILGVASSSNSDICEKTQYSTYTQATSQEYIQWFKDVLDKSKDFEDLYAEGRCKQRTWGQEFCRLYAC